MSDGVVMAMNCGQIVYFAKLVYTNINTLQCTKTNNGVVYMSAHTHQLYLPHYVDDSRTENLYHERTSKLISPSWFYWPPFNLLLFF